MRTALAFITKAMLLLCLSLPCVQCNTQKQPMKPWPDVNCWKDIYRENFTTYRLHFLDQYLRNRNCGEAFFGALKDGSNVIVVKLQLDNSKKALLKEFAHIPILFDDSLDCDQFKDYCFLSEIVSKTVFEEVIVTKPEIFQHVVVILRSKAGEKYFYANVELEGGKPFANVFNFLNNDDSQYYPPKDKKCECGGWLDSSCIMWTKKFPKGCFKEEPFNGELK